MNNWQPDVKFEEGVFKFDLPNGDEFVIVPPQTKPLSDEEINLLKAEIAAHKKTNELLSQKIIELQEDNKK